MPKTTQQGQGEKMHTPGPWGADDGESDWLGIFAENGEPIAYLIEPSDYAKYKQLPVDEKYEAERGVFDGQKYSRALEQQANANLMAAAPEMLEELERLYWLYGRQKTANVIAKAKGKDNV